MEEGHKFETAKAALDFILGGNATFTLRSKVTGTRFTYRVRAAKNGKVWFVSLLRGADNTSDYAYFGFLRNGSWDLTEFHYGAAKAKVSEEAPGVKAFIWAWERIRARSHDETNGLPANLEVWHQGHCGRCGRPLTVPESIESGFGPECSRRLAA